MAKVPGTKVEFNMPSAAAGFPARGGWVLLALREEFGLSENQAGGIVGNLGFESGRFKTLQEIRPSVSGSRGGYGWAQWTASRRVDFEAWARKNKLALSSDQANFGFLVWELKNTHQHCLTAMKPTDILDRCVFTFGRLFENPGGTTPTHLPGFDDRLKIAKEAVAGARKITLGGVTVGQGEISSTPAGTPRALIPEGVVLRKGSRSESVRVMQQLLIEMGFEELSADGVFGQATEDAVKEYQGLVGLARDGIAGPATVQAINEDKEFV